MIGPPNWLLSYCLCKSLNQCLLRLHLHSHSSPNYKLVPIPASDCPAALVFSHVRRFATCSPLASCGPPGSSVHGILQERILEWVAISSHRGSSWPRDRTCFSCVSCIAGRFFTAEPPLNTRMIDYLRTEDEAMFPIKKAWTRTNTSCFTEL